MCMTDMKTTKNKLTNKKYSPTMRKIKVTRFEGGSNSFKTFDYYFDKEWYKNKVQESIY